MDDSQNRERFTVFVELQAVMDYMTLLRGITKDGKHFADRTSFEFARFPSFDGSDWQLDIDFADFFDDVVKNKRLFERVRPYDFSVRDLAFLSEHDADLVLYIPEDFSQYHGPISQWCQNYFPSMRTAAGNIIDINANANLWVARSIELATELIKKNQPFVLIDGKENRELQNVVRAIRWDQAGYFLRQAQFIDRLIKQNPHELRVRQIPANPYARTHVDLNQGYSVFPPNAAEAAIWVGEQQRISELFLRPEFEFTHDDGTSLTAQQIKEAKKAIASDVADLNRKRDVLAQYAQEGFDTRIKYPQWARFMRGVEIEMQSQLREIELLTQTNPVTGELPKKRKRRAPNIPATPKNLKPVTISEEVSGERLIFSLKDFGMPKKFQAIELIESISEMASKGAILRGKSATKSNIVGSLAEDIAAYILDKNGWQILIPMHRKNVPHTARNNGDITVYWIDEEGKRVHGAVDFIARDPNGELHIIEVKAKRSSDLSPQQKKLRLHLLNGGRILNPNLVGLRKDQKTFSAKYHVVAFDQIMSRDRRTKSRSR